MKEERFTCTRDGLTIRGTIVYPDDFTGSGKYPCLIASHGFTGNYPGMLRWCRDFAGLGYVAAAYGFCGGGCLDDDPEFSSDGDTTAMTISTEIADLEAVMDHMLSLPYVDPTRLILIGESQGGFVSGLTAARHSDAVSRLIMIFPAICIPDHARQGRLAGASYSVDDVPDIIDIGRTRLGRCIHDDVVGLDPYLELSRYTGPVLILQGLEDQVVNYSYAIRAKENYAPGQCHLQLIRSMGHGLDEGQHASAFDSICEFLNNRREILTIQVVITNSEQRKEEDATYNDVYFTGYCDSEIFRGAILPRACDTQKYLPDGTAILHAEYALLGLDHTGAACHIHVLNRGNGRHWTPEVSSDSPNLAWLKDTDLTAVLEYGEGGPTVRIYAPDDCSRFIPGYKDMP